MKSASILLLCFIYYVIGYELERSQFWLLFSLYSAAFGLSIYLYRSGIRLKFLIGLSFLFKLIFLVSIPELSQDFYRFIWDGMLNSLGLNPYLHLPSEIVKSDAVNAESLSPMLYENMGSLSANNYSTYPPIAQLIYSLTYDLAGANLLLNVMYLRLFHLLAELGLVYFSLKILKKINLPQKQILFFIMNPLVILELSFSLHFEGVMLLFLALSLYYLYACKIYISALGFAAAVASKLLPLMFLPLLFPYLNKRLKLLNRPQLLTYLKFTGVSLLSLILAYSFLWDSDLLFKNSRTLALYFTSFEFNASFYYLLRWIGFQWSGYNMIGLFGKILPVITLALILFLSLRHKKINFKTLVYSMLFIATAYYLLSTTVHPWYITLPLFLSMFTPFKYMLLWSWLVFLSYSAYKIEGVEENHWLIGLQYAAVVALMLYEGLKNRSLFSRIRFLA
ncbi:glycosyltransferase ArnT-like protein [Psychroflexus aurantiacus]|nr:glycosyltransferase ArnT-like protein [Psychroflexus aurantiacus]